MADSTRIKIEGVNPLIDGEYPLDPADFSNRDVHDVNRIAGVLPVDFEEQFAKRNVALMVAFAVIALRRAGKPHSGEAEEALWDAKTGRITLIGEGADALPPEEETPNGSGVEQSKSTVSSGNSSSDGREDLPVPDPSSTGQSVSDSAA